MEAPTSAVVVDTSISDECSFCGKRGHLSQVSRTSGGNANARVVDVELSEPEEEKEIHIVWALYV